MAAELRSDQVDDEIQNGSVDLATADESQASDNDGGERPVRKQLKETSITSVPKSYTATGESQEGASSRESSRKRSFDDDEMENNEDDGHRRKRSRDSSPEPTAKADEGETGRPGSTLKKKRSRDQLDKDEKSEDNEEKAQARESSETGVSADKPAVEGEPEKKRHRDDSRERDPAPISSAFANTSSISPFGAIGASTTKPTEEAKPTTSASAFASSSLSAFAGSEQSPFSSLGASTPSIFKSSADSTPAAATAESEKPAATGFAALGSGFSGFSSGFGAASSGGLTSFASATAPSALGSSTSKAFGAAEDSDEDDDKEDDEESGPAEFAEDKTDERFFERPQKMETGEEEEKTYFSCKSKLFHFSNMEWRERGLGTFKVNVKVIDGVEDKKSARMIMRADGVGRVILNAPLFSGMKIGDAAGKEPKSKQINLPSLEEGRTVPLLLRVGNEDQAKDLYRTLKDLLENL